MEICMYVCIYVYVYVYVCVYVYVYVNVCIYIYIYIYLYIRRTPCGSHGCEAYFCPLSIVRCLNHCQQVISQQSVVTVCWYSTPSLNGSPAGSIPINHLNKYVLLPVCLPSKTFKIQHLSVGRLRKSGNVCPNDLSATTIHLRGHSRSHTCCLNTHQSAIVEHHRIAYTSLTSETYTINMTKPWSPTTVYNPPAIIKITTHARG